ncbi:hypothetical protein [Aurantiacibacter suaedae]|uniref:hypothetical protein n=1 Tax=Aurantiacibacter suaedae TaxID=2545755 RepID=UPI0010F6DAED|nr:hypothetical protein [Aurantiacibacter suaedae]
MIASAGPNLPLAVLRATGAYAGPLPIDLDKPVTTASDWMESKFAPWAPLALQAWADGDYDHLDRVVFSRADDTAQRFYYYVCELQRRGLVGGPEAILFDVAMIPRQSSLERTEQKVRELADLLGVGDSAIDEAIMPASGAAPSGEQPLCLIAGSPMPDRRLHDAVEAAGFAAAGQTLAQYWGEEAGAVEQGTGEPCAAIARALHASASGPRSFADRADFLADRLARSGAEAAILWRIEEDEAQVWHLPAERRVLEESGVPHLVLTRRDWFARDGAGEEISRFLAEVTT